MDDLIKVEIATIDSIQADKLIYPASLSPQISPRTLAVRNS